MTAHSDIQKILTDAAANPGAFDLPHLFGTCKQYLNVAAMEISRLTSELAALQKENAELETQLDNDEKAWQKEGQRAYDQGKWDGYQEGHRDGKNEPEF